MDSEHCDEEDLKVEMVNLRMQRFKLMQESNDPNLFEELFGRLEAAEIQEAYLELIGD